LAKRPPNPHEQSVPVQLRLIRASLVDLSNQMSAMEASLNGKISDVQSSVNVGNGKLDVLQTSADSIYDVVTSVDITMTTEVCFDAAVYNEYSIGGHGEFGVGWPNVLDAKLAVEADGGYGAGVGIGNQICIQVPLYSVESNVPLFTNTGEFDDLIAAIAMPAQNVVPLIGEVYTALMPTPAEALQAVENVITAATTKPEDLLRPDIVLDPIVPQILKDFVTKAPDIIEGAVLDPCGTFANSPLGAQLAPSTYDWICLLDPDETQQALDTIVGVVNSILPLVETIEAWLP